MAAGFLTRLPLPPVNPGERKLLRAGWCFPLVGAVIGAAGGIVLWIAAALDLPAMACGLAALGGIALLTGALHEDGLADLADGFGGGRDKNAKIAIMRDSRIGSYGVLALVIATGLKTTAIAALITSGDAVSAAIALVVAHACSRGLIPSVALALPNAVEEGLGAAAGKPKASTVQIALAICTVFLLTLLPLPTAAIAGAAGCGAAALVAVLARKQIGGYTGDVLGAVEQAAGTAILLTLAAMIGG